MSYPHPNQQQPQGYDAQAYAQYHAQQHGGYSQQSAAAWQHQAHAHHHHHHHQHHATQAGPSATSPAQHAAYYQQQVGSATSSSSSRSKPSGAKAKDKKTRGKHTPAGTLLEVEKQWAAYYEQQRHSGGYKGDDDDDDNETARGHEWQAAGPRRYPEPNFAAFTLAGGKSYLEDGSPSPLSSTSSESGGSTYRTAGSY